MHCPAAPVSRSSVAPASLSPRLRYFITDREPIALCLPTENKAEASETMSDLRTHAAEIAEQFSDHLDVDEDEVEERLENLVEEYRVPVEEARRSVVNSYLEEAGLERDEIGRGGNDEVHLADID